VDFAGVERYIDTPVKRYSSGMYVRLAFAVAAHLEPEILIVDEVLAVGDAEFQKKCLGKMKDVSVNQGRTVLFVSHQMDAIARLSNRALLFTNGQLIHNGDADKAIRLYSNKLTDGITSKKWDSNRPGNEKVRLNSAVLREKDGHEKVILDISKAFEIILEYEVLTNSERLTCGINIFNEDGDYLFTSHDVKNATKKVNLKKGVYESIVTIPGNFLAEGLMTASVSIMSYDPFVVHFHEAEVLSFSILDNQEGNTARGIYAGKFPGLIRPLLEWETIMK
jgi:lipopolysaccharide transport system ATP-binding protein